MENINNKKHPDELVLETPKALEAVKNNKCPHCGSTNLKVWDHEFKKIGYIELQWGCNSCKKSWDVCYKPALLGMHG